VERLKSYVITENAFEKGLEKYHKAGYTARDLKIVIKCMVRGDTKILIDNYKYHALQGKYDGQRALHLDKEDKWVLRYEIILGKVKLIDLLDLGNHDKVYR
jgi:addiction module RelE/StbE family toxin